MRSTLLLHKAVIFVLIVLIVPTAILSLTFSGVTVTGQTETPTPTAQPMETGQVISIGTDRTSLVIQSGSTDTATIIVSQNTVYEMSNINPATLIAFLDLVESFMGQGKMSTDAFTSIILSQFRQPATFDDISVGDIVAIENPTDSPVESVSIIKIPNVRGTITAITSDSITIEPLQGEPVTLNWDSNTRFLLKGIASIEAGHFASVIYDEAANMSLLAIINSPIENIPPSPIESPAPANVSGVNH